MNKETGRLLPFDIAVHDLQTLVEVDGGQHFKQVMQWKSPDLHQQRDIYKMEEALLNEWKIVRISAKLVQRENVCDWQMKLMNAITSNLVYDSVAGDKEQVRVYKIHSEHINNIL